MNKTKNRFWFWDIWTKNWENAKRFFDSKGNIKTRAKLKAKWLKDFEKDIIEVYQKDNLRRLR